jgi:hypothetical protein
LIAYVDADTRPDSGWLEALSEAFVAPEVAAVTGLVVADALETDPQILFDGERTGGTSFDLQTHARRGFANTYYPQLCGAQCNMAFRRESLNRLGGFDPALDFGSEASGSAVDVFQRLLESDAVIVYEPHVLVRQQQPRTWGAVERRLFDEARARSIVLWAAMRRARGRERFRVFAAYSRWFFHTWRRLLRRVVRRGERMPVKFLLLELAAGPAGMVAYSRGRRREQARS